MGPLALVCQSCTKNTHLYRAELLSWADSPLSEPRDFQDILMTKLPFCSFRKYSSFHFIYKWPLKGNQTFTSQANSEGVFLHLFTEEVKCSLSRGVLSTKISGNMGRALLVLQKLPKHPFSLPLCERQREGKGFLPTFCLPQTAFK